MTVDEGQQKEGTPVKEPEIVDGKHPDNVSWSQYVGIKESLGGKLDKATKEVTDLKEQAKTTVSTEAHEKVATELEGTKRLLADKTTELDTKVAATLTEKRAALVTKGVPEEKVKEMSVEVIDAVLAVEMPKPKSDLGGGGGGSDTPTSGGAKIRAGFEALHPSNK